MAAYPRMAEYDERQLGRTREDLGHHVDYVIAALRTEDPDVYHEMVGWLDEVLAARGLASEALRTSLRVCGTSWGCWGTTAPLGSSPRRRPSSPRPTAPER